MQVLENGKIIVFNGTFDSHIDSDVLDYQNIPYQLKNKFGDCLRLKDVKRVVFPANNAVEVHSEVGLVLN